MRAPETWIRQSRMSDPGDHAANIAGLPPQAARLNAVIQGLLVHSDWLATYDLDEIGFSRATLAVADRLGDILGRDSSPFEQRRPPRKRSIGTCRDFALMLTSFLRCHEIPARVRCGFAAYLGGAWEDHWVCERWDRCTQAWRLSDAQIDEKQKERCRIDFDPADVPRRSFKTAGEAWTACRAGERDADSFGHGETRGLWFLGVNVMRDHFVLNGREVSPWDRWREAPKPSRVWSETETDLMDRLAADPEQPLRDSLPTWLA